MAVARRRPAPDPTEDNTMTSTPRIVDLATWQAARDELLAREKAHTREGDAIAAARRRLPMVEFDGTVEVVGPDGPVPFLSLFEGRDELVVYKHMWYDDTPHQGQCEGCTTTAWHLKDAVYLNARGVSFAIVTTGRWAEVAAFVEFMGYTQPWYSVRGVEGPAGGPMGFLTCYLRDGDRTFLTYSTTGRGNERVNGSMGLLDLTPYGRGESWEDNPKGWPEGGGACWTWRSDADGNATWGPTSRPVPQWTRPGATPVETLGRRGRHH
uniref:Bll6640 protein n=2 Tax=Nonomuraea gerenzanensis TaxID=93944 RepID=A0A1M4EED6_9ACTN|nr:Bll6640 protein [Nonomuraea gerenzanensis]